jgi:SAM-dependent methyltransferase
MATNLDLAQLFPLRPPLPLPEGETEESMRAFLATVRVDPGPREELAAYCRSDLRRFLYTYGLVRGLAGDCLELGANPYFTTMLLRRFTDLELTLANYFSPQSSSTVVQTVVFEDPRSGEEERLELSSYHFNIEEERFPFQDGTFNVVLCCEIIEHLLRDPLAVLLEIKRVLRLGGALVLTTPNVNRIENVARMIAGANIYDPYSGYGPYGRHNREYNKHELGLLLKYAGFEIDRLDSADVHPNEALLHFPRPEFLLTLLRSRKADLGQYLFARALNTRPAGKRKPTFLFRSYAPEQLEEVT